MRMSESRDEAPLRIAEAVPVLERTPAVLRALLEGLPPPWLAADEGEGTFTPLQVLGHLAEAEERLWIPRARMILAEGEPEAFPPFDRFADMEQHRRAAPGDLLDRFERLRCESLVELRALAPDPDDLARAGRHPEFGPVTLSQLLATWVAHDLAHSRQIFRVMAKRYRNAVGPWRSYLRVMAE